MTPRALNRALLARQFLITRHGRDLTRQGRSPERPGGTALDTVARLVGLQAQIPSTPYVALWSRLEGFTFDQLSRLIDDRAVVRLALMRSTLHLVTADDALGLRPLVQPAIDRSFHGAFGRHVQGLDAAAVAAEGRALVDEQPRTFAELGARLAETHPGRDPNALAQVVRTHVPLVQVPPRGLWGQSGPVAHTSIEAWLGRAPAPYPIDDVVRRYLAAFGPATAKDVQTWSGLTRLREVLDRLRPELVVLHDPHGTELFDLPDAPRPDPDTPAPPRFLPEYDNVLLAHADRSRIVSDADRRRVTTRNEVLGTVLVDGFVAGTWRVVRRRRVATLGVALLRGTADEHDAVHAEAVRLLAVLAADAETREVRLTLG